MLDKTKAIIESILFISGDEGVDESQLALALDITNDEAIDLICLQLPPIEFHMHKVLDSFH